VSWCENQREHERNGRYAFERHNYSDYREARRNRYEDDCKAAFVSGFERAEREDRKAREDAEDEATRSHYEADQEVEEVWPKVMETLPTDVLEWAVRFEGLGNGGER
jgi:hypothetical protein